jgi:hypothetical protein
MSIPTIAEVMAAFISVFDGSQLSNGQTLTAGDKVIDETAIADDNLPYLWFRDGSFSLSSWKPWEPLVTYTQPSFLKVKIDRTDDGAREMREILDDLIYIAWCINGLPVDADGVVVPFSPQTAALIDNDELDFLCERTGPRISQVSITEMPGTPYVKISITWALEFVANYDRRELAAQLRSVVIGVQARTKLGEEIDSIERTYSLPVDSNDPLTAAGVDFSSRVSPPFTSPAVLISPDPAVDDSTTILRIDAVPAAFDLPLTATKQLTALVTYRDGSVVPTTAATWSSSDASKATVSPSGGLVTAVANGTVTITCTLGTRTATVTVRSGSGLLSYTATVQADNPWVWWRFNEVNQDPTIVDTMGRWNAVEQGPSSTFYQEPPLTTEAGQYSQRSDNTSSSWITNGSGSGFPIPSSPITLEWWMKSTPIADTNNSISLQNATGALLIQLSGSGGALSVAHTPSGASFTTAAGTIVNNVTAHLVVTYDGTTVTLYKNGVQIGSGTGAVAQQFTELRWNPTNRFGGWVDEIAVYKSVLGSDRILTHYLAGTQ